MEIKKNIPNNTITRKLVDLDRETGSLLHPLRSSVGRASPSRIL